MATNQALSLGHNPPCTSLRQVCVGFGSQNAENRTADARRQRMFWETQDHAESALRLLWERSRHVRAAHGGAPPTCVAGTVWAAGKCKFNASRDLDSRASNVRARCHQRTRDAAAAYLLCSERACHAPCRHVGGTASVLSVGIIYILPQRMMPTFA